MVRYNTGTVFNADTDAIVNTVNCDGFMGAGIALEFGLRYPDMLKIYEEKCKANEIKVGSIDIYKDTSGVTIVNFPTKIHFKYASKLEWIEMGLKAFVECQDSFDFDSIAFPKLGTSKGGLDWKDVKTLMERYLQPLDIDVVICLDENRAAEGIEKNMLDMFNSSSIETLSNITKLTASQRELILKERPYNRFWRIGQEKGIGKKTYAALFTYYYLKAKGDTVEEQLSLF